MSSLMRIVVGDCYASFAKNESVVTFAAIEPELPRLGRQHTLVMGQGLTSRQRQRLIEAGEAKSAPRVVGGEESSPRELTHKASAENVLCSLPVLLGGTTYRSRLLVNPAIDRLCDHTTGQHVNGMLLIEAARQAGIAAIESCYLRNDSRKWGFSWSRCDCRFLGFAFPVPTDIVAQLPEVRDFAQQQQVPMTVAMVVMQAGAAVCEVSMEVTLIEGTFIEKIEARRAKRVVTSLLSGLNQAEPLAQPA